MCSDQNVTWNKKYDIFKKEYELKLTLTEQKLEESQTKLSKYQEHDEVFQAICHNPDIIKLSQDAQKFKK